jgi:hypothetical protein
MARVTDVFLNGSVGNIIFYRRMDKNCARIKRTSIQQTDATKIRGINFGIASRACKALRSGLTAAIPFPKDRSMQTRFCGVIAKWLGQSNADTLLPDDALPYIRTFSFTTGYSFSERFKVPVTISQPQDQLIIVNIAAFIPAMQISAPAGTGSVTLVLSVAGCLLKNGEATGSETHTMLIPYNDITIPAQSFEFHVPMPAGSLTVTAGRLIYNVVGNNGLSCTKNPAFVPAGVIDARYW